MKPSISDTGLSQNKENRTKENDLHFLMEHEGGQLLCSFGLPIVPGELAKDEKEAVDIASRIGYPVVLKGMSRTIVHKTEAGIVRLHIRNEEELIQHYREILKNAKRYDPKAEIAGVLVQKMAEKGLEIIIGVKKDPIFGHQLVMGMGGIFVEVFKDFSMRMMPVSDEETEEMLQELKSYPLLQGYRGGPQVDLNAIKKIVSGLNRLVQSRPDVVELDLNPVMVSEKETVVCDVAILTDPSCQPEGETAEVLSMDQRKERESKILKKMLNPQSIAVIGASTDEKKNGGRLFRYIVENGFAGDLYPVNPKADQIKGYQAYKSVLDIPGPVDLACIIVAARFVPQVVEDCVKKGIPAAIIYSSGFAEIGEEGKKLQDKILATARAGSLVLLGPNSIGVASPGKNIYTAFGAALESKVKRAGHIGFVSQSGAMGSALLSRAWEQGAGFSRWISVANEADLSTSDFINVLADDEETKVITAFMESVKDKNAFQQAAQKALAQKKPLLVFKTGSSEVGKRAVQSHTGSMAGDDAVYTAAFEKFGVLRLERIEELIDVSRAFEIQPVPRGKKIGIVTASGGACSVIADLCSKKGLEIPLLKDTAREIEKLIPPFGNAQNPVDVTAEVIAKPEMFQKVLETLVEDPEVNGMIVMLTTNADPGATVIAQSILDVFQKQKKPIVVGRLGADMIAPKAMELYQQHAFPVYATPEKTVSVMSYLVQYGRLLQKIKGKR